MAKQTINIGTSANKGDGDPLRTAFDKINDNFDELYSATTLDLDSIGSNMIPTTNGNFSLGSASKQWSDLYVKDFIYIGGTRLETDAAGNIVVSGGSLQIKDVQGDIFADDSTKVFDSATQTFTGKFEGELVGTVAADDSTVLIDGVAGTINAGALTGALPAIDGSALTGISASSVAFSNITSKPTTLAGYGIADAYTKTEVDNAITSSVLPSGSAQSIDVVAQDSTVLVDSVNGTLNATTLTGALPAIDGSALTGVTTAFSNITSTPTTLAGYGITDAATLNNMAPTGAVDFTGATSIDFNTATINNLEFADISTTPTTLSGYGITDAYTQTQVDTAITNATSSIVIPSGSSQSIDVVAADSTLLVDSSNGTLNSSALTKPIDLDDNEEVRFGTDNDMRIYHSGTTGNIDNNTGTLIISGPTVRIQDGALANTAISAADGIATLLFENSAKLATSTDGVAITGKITGLTDPTDAQDAATKAYVDANSGGGGSGLQSRSTATGNTNSLADAAEADLDITGFKSYALLTITTDRAARVRLYVSAATRTADASRAEGVDPTSDAGLIAEVITTGSETVTISPGAYGFNLESTPTTTIPCRVTNKSGGTATVQVTLNILQLEA